MYRNAVHYEASDEPVGTRIQEGGFEENTCPVVSAGHPKHEYTTGYAQKEIFMQFDLLSDEEKQALK